eukprot:3325956-Rhodomonas_salina.2
MCCALSAGNTPPAFPRPQRPSTARTFPPTCAASGGCGRPPSCLSTCLPWALVPTQMCDCRRRTMATMTASPRSLSLR